MSRAELLTIIITALALLILPALAFLVRITVKWQRVEDNLKEVTDDLTEIVKENAGAHKELYKLTKGMQEALDRRIRWLEQNVWNRRR
jgi:uncharacterized protein YoxC